MRTIAVSSFTLGRGSAFVDLALRGQHLNPSVSDLIGIVAAYIATDRDIDQMVPDLSKRYPASLAIAAKATFDLHLNREDGLWTRGPAWEDIQYENKKMIDVFANEIV